MTTNNTPDHLGPNSPATKAFNLTTRNLQSSMPSGTGFQPVSSPPSSPPPAYPGSTHTLPTHNATNPGTDPKAPTPGSFALAPDIGGPLAYASPDTPGMPAPSTKTAWDFLPEGWSVEEVTKCRSDKAAKGPKGKTTMPLGHSATPPLQHTTFTDARGITRTVTFPKNFTPVTQLEHARLGLITPQMRRVAQREPHLTAEQIRDEVAAGRMVIPANIHHLQKNLDPICIGRASKTKVNANMGASPVSSGTEEEVEKLRWAERWGADTVMDLSTGGDLDACRQAIIDAATVPIGTVPIYSMIIGRKIEDLTIDIILESVEHQAKQGVDYMTLHAGILKRHIPLVKNRLIGIVSRGGSLLAKWMLHHDAENPMYEHWEQICDVMRRHDVTFSIGDGLRPGGLADATDQAQLAELATIAELTERAWRRGVQVMVEGPGHVPFDQIEYNAKLQRTLCHGAPFYVLGPLVTDVFPGYDHITSAIGATAIAYHGAAMLCYVTPKEHLGLPKRGDVKEGCIAYKIAAHAADVALGIPGTRDWDDDLTKARAALNWQKHFELAYDEDTARAYHDEDLDVDTDFCAMCGHDWCSVRISKEIQEFASGKAEGFARGKAIKSAALTVEQKAILEQRGYLKPEEIHALTNKLKAAPNAGDGPAETSPSRERGDASTVSPSAPACHSDYVDPDEAKRIQREKLGEELVQLNTAHDIPSDNRLC